MDRNPLGTAARAGFVYAAVAFAAGFALGIVRVTTVAPHLGETGAVVAELPLMLILTWFACRSIITRFRVPATLSARAAMGSLALLLLLFAETALAILGLDRTLHEQFMSYRNLPERLGLAAQVLFGLFPLVMRNRC